MKKVLALLLVLSICASSAFAQEAEAEAEGTPVLDQMARGTGRGLINIATGWLELPRNLVVEVSRNPYYGLFTGVSDGSWLSLLRTLGGTTDLATLGLTGEGFHSEQFPHYVWDSTWIPTDTMIKQ